VGWLAPKPGSIHIIRGAKKGHLEQIKYAPEGKDLPRRDPARPPQDGPTDYLDLAVGFNPPGAPAAIPGARKTQNQQSPTRQRTSAFKRPAEER